MKNSNVEFERNKRFGLKNEEFNVIQYVKKTTCMDCALLETLECNQDTINLTGIWFVILCTVCLLSMPYMRTDGEKLLSVKDNYCMTKTMKIKK